MSSTKTSLDLTAVSDGLAERCRLWRSQLQSTESIDRTATAKAVDELYALVGKPSPGIVWCESPFQILAMVAVLEKQVPQHAIRKWESHPAPLRLSEADFSNLWNRMWRQLEAQIDPATRTTIVEPDTTTEKKWSETMGKNFFAKLTRQADTTAKNLWSGTHHSLMEVWATLEKEMRAPCAIRFEGDAKYQALERRYQETMGATIDQSGTRQLLTDIQAFTSAGFNLGMFERINAENLTALGIETLKGNFVDEFDKIYTPEDRKSLDFAWALALGCIMMFGRTRYQTALGLIPFYDYLCDELPNLPIGPSNRKKAKVFLNLVRQTPLMICLDRVAFVCERPLVCERDDAGRLHKEDGPALVYADGYQIFSWHGATVPSRIICDPGSITFKDIIKEWNAEIRRVMVERYGLGRFIETSGAIEVQKDECGVLYRWEFANDEPLVLVKVMNSTPEPDGTFKPYFLRVPPSMTTAREAVAWTFDMRPEEYSPSQQT